MPTPARALRLRPVPHLQRDRLGTFYFRLTIDGRTRRRSLRTKDESLAIMRASKLNYEWSMAKRPTEPCIPDILAAFEKDGRRFDVVLPNDMQINGINADEDGARAKRFIEDVESIGLIKPHLRPSRAEYAQLALKRPPRPFLAATKPYLREKAKDAQNGRKTLDDKESLYTAFATRFEDPDMASIAKPMAVVFKQSLVDSAAGSGRVNAKIGYLSDFFEWAVAHGEADANPFAGLRVSRKSKLSAAVESFEPFTAEEIAAIIDPATYPAYASKPHYHWLPFLLLHTGARPNELAGLRLDQVRREQGIDYFAIKAGKNTNSLRKIPFHRSVFESAFPAYVEQRRKAEPSGQLFPLLAPTKNGYAKNLSRRFNESYLPSLRIDDPTHRLYSFRSTFITRMSELNVNTAMLMALVGHYEQEAVDLSSPHFKNYQGAKRIAALKETIDLLDITLPTAF